MVSITRRAIVATLALAAVGYAGYRGYVRATTVKPTFVDLAYGPGARQVLDIHLPEGEGPFPFVLEIHGGAFKHGSKTMAQPSAALLGAGIAIVKPNYRFSTTDLWPAQGEDCLAALQFVLAGAGQYKLDPARFATFGQSSGGFLSVSTGLSMTELGNPPRAVVDFYGPMDFSAMDADMEALGRTPAMGATGATDSAESLLLGFAVADDPAKAKSIGPVGRLEAMAPRTLPPLFIRHGDADMMIAHGQSERLAAAWARVDPATRIDLEILADAGHGGTAFDADDTMTALRDFLLASF